MEKKKDWKKLLESTWVNKLNSHIGLEGQGNPIEIRLIKKNYNVQFPTNLMWNDEIKKKKFKTMTYKNTSKVG
jgi:hypothetical protein